MKLKGFGKFLFSAAVVSFIFVHAHAANDKEKVVGELLRKSGFEDQLKIIPQVVTAATPTQIAVFKAVGDAGINTFVKKNSEKYFIAGDMLKSVAKYLQEKYNETYAGNYLKWLDGKIGKKVTKMELAASTPAAAAGIMSYMLKMDENPPKENRVAMVQKLIKSLDIVEHTKQQAGDTFAKMANGINKNLPANRKVPEDELKKIKIVFQESLVMQIENYLVPTYLYTYKDLADDELQKYVDELASGEGSWFHKNLSEAHSSAVESGAEKFGSALGERIAKIIIPEQAELKWEKNKLGQGDIEIEFPAKTEIQKQEIPIEGGTALEMNMISAEINGMVFMISWIDDYPPLVQGGADIKELLTNMADGSANNVGGQIVVAEYITRQGGHPGVEFDVSILSANRVIRSQIFCIGKKYVQLMIIAGIGDVYDKENDRYFASLEIKK